MIVQTSAHANVACPKVERALALIVGLSACAVFGADVCEKQIPTTLRSALSKAFPKYRVPLATDNLREDNDYNLKQGGTGCIAVASGDFNGDGKTDYVVAMTARTGPGGLVIVALAQTGGWRWRVLDEWKDSRLRLFVDTEKAGTYSRTPALDGPLEAGEVETLECGYALPAHGATESTEVAYCYADGKWPHVWLSD